MTDSAFLHVWKPDGPYSGLVWFRGMRKPQVGPKKRNVEEARRWCLRRLMREKDLNRAIVVRHDPDDFIPVWKVRVG